MLITIDIETLPDLTPGALDAIKSAVRPPANYSKPETVEKWMMENAGPEAEKQWRKTALNGTTGQLCSIGWAVENEPAKVLVRDDSAGGEAGLLQRFYSAMEEALRNRNGHYASTRWCGHNVAFDLRFIYQRSVICGIKPPVCLYHEAKAWSEYISDTMTMWAGHSGTISLHNLCLALDIPTPKDGVDGSQVFDLWQAGEYDRIATYCKADVEATRECYQRLVFRDPLTWVNEELETL